MRSVVPIAVALVVGGCGRVGFEPHDQMHDANGGVLGGVVDGRLGAGENGTCATAAEIAVGSMLANETIDATDDVTPWGLCPSGPDVVYQITVGTDTSVAIVAQATFAVQITTSRTCPPSLTGPSSCYTAAANQPFNRSYTLSAGTTYIVVDKLSGTGSSFDIAVQ